MLTRTPPLRTAAVLILVAVSILGAAVPSIAASPDVDCILHALACLPFDAFADECYRQIMLRDPDTLWASGLQDEYGLASFAEWTDLSAEALAEGRRLDTGLLDLLHRYERACLTPAQKLDYDVYEWYLEDRIQFHAFPFWDFALGPSAYGAQNQGLDLLLQLPIETVAQAEDYVTRLEGTAAWMDQLIEGFRLWENASDPPTQIAIAFTLSELDAVLRDVPDWSLSRQLPAYTSFVERLDLVEGLTYTKRAELLAGAREAIISAVIPAYRALRAYVASLDGHGSEAGIYGHEQREALYAALLSHHTTRDVTPEEAVEIAEREIARLQEEMRTFAADELGWPADLSMVEFNARLTEANVPVLQGEELLPLYEQLVEDATAALDLAFDIFPSTELVVTVEPDGAPAYCREPPIDGSGPGEVVVSLLNIVPFTAYDEPVLMHHEGNPGHNFQLAIQRDLDLSLLRRDMTSSVYFRHPIFQAYIEGWALYSEPLAHELGLYDDDPIGGLCQKRLELVRTARVVADVGLNVLGWSWDEAASYLLETTGRTESPTGSLRYDSYPAQALAYDIGYLTFLDLRRGAENALGDSFDLKEFHRVILENGALPMEILERIVEEWVNEKAAVATSTRSEVSVVQTAEASLPFDEFVDDVYRRIMVRDPDTVWSYELQDEYDLENFTEWTDLSLDAFDASCRLDLELLAELRTYDRESLSPEQQLEYDVHEWHLEDRIRLHDYPYWYHPIGPYSYGPVGLAFDLLSFLPVDSVTRAEDYVTRLQGFSAWMDSLIESLQARESSGVLPTQLAIEMTLAELDDLLQPIADSALAARLTPYTSFVQRLLEIEGLEAETRSRLLSEARDAIVTSVLPGLRAYRDHIAALDGRTGDVGVLGYENGSAYYEAVREHFVLRNLAPEEILEIADREVTRLQSEIRRIAVEDLGWPENLSLEEINGRITAANQPILEGEDLLELYQELVDRATEALDRVFEIFPESELVITADPDGPPAAYIEPPIDKSGPGQIPTNLMNFVPYSAYDEPVLMHHEGNPGHHYQLALMRDMDLSILRRDRFGHYYTRHPTFQGFTEGWALYAQALAQEMGLYEDDPVGAICELRLQLVQVSRTRADIGLNVLGWTWEEAADYLFEATGRLTHETDSLRYDSYPAQAVGYGIGYLTFCEMRRAAEEALGDRFDVKEFHRVILEHGAIPFEILERIFDEWLEGKLAAG